MLVSVIIPTFNRRTVVCDAVASVYAQQGADFEVVVVDDGSTDGTAGALAAAFGSRIRLLSTENRGVAAARNLGVAHSRGALIAFLDSDDCWLSGKLAAQVDFFAAHPAADICQTEEIWIRNGVRVNPRATSSQAAWRDLRSQSAPVPGEPVGGDAAARACSSAPGGFDETSAGVRRLRPVAAHRARRRPCGLSIARSSSSAVATPISCRGASGAWIGFAWPRWRAS